MVILGSHYKCISLIIITFKFLAISYAPHQSVCCRNADPAVNETPRLLPWVQWHRHARIAAVNMLKIVWAIKPARSTFAFRLL